MSAIYEPKGKAREYSPLALNLYRGCDHRCSYCYVPSVVKSTREELANPTVRPNILNVLRNELEKNVPLEQILLSFTGDPYCAAEEEFRVTRAALEMLNHHKCRVAILTKGGDRSLHDLDLFKRFGERIKIGATLTLWDASEQEPGAAPTAERLAALERLHTEGIRTWASFEPVLDPVQTLELIHESSSFVDQFKIGKLNHDAKLERSIDWSAFVVKATKMLREIGKPFYIKHDLAACAPHGFEFIGKERDHDALALIPRAPLVEQVQGGLF